MNIFLLRQVAAKNAHPYEQKAACLICPFRRRSYFSGYSLPKKGEKNYVKKDDRNILFHFLQYVYYISRLLNRNFANFHF